RLDSTAVKSLLAAQNNGPEFIEKTFQESSTLPKSYVVLTSFSPILKASGTHTNAPSPARLGSGLV
ncbi:MAG TPA: hypothetical protein VGR96_00110, partial [Acidobacteriaceae bacterium]|nr:hypothetical protein [Acidobacteriaceae bacterium]